MLRGRRNECAVLDALLKAHHLPRLFSKLGITSRSQLRQALPQRECRSGGVARWFPA